MNRTTKLFFAIVTTVALCAFGSDEPSELEEIIVTAVFRSNELGSIPSSIAVVTEEAIARRNATHLEEVLNTIPNVNYSKGSSRARYFQIRGIGERGQFDEPINSSVGLIIDGIELSGIGTVATLFDVKQIEVLRGPQGTLYGANALAGLINVVTNKPTDIFESKLELGMGNYNSFGIGGVISGPLSNGVRARLAARTEATDGFMNNHFLNTNKTDNQDEMTLRGRLSWELDNTTNVDLAAGILNVRNGYDAFSLDNNRNTLSDEPGYDRQDTNYGSISIHWNGNKKFTTTANAGLANSDIDYGYDEDWTFDGFHPWGYKSTDKYLRDRSTINAEIRFVSKEAGRLFADSTDWTFGAYTLNQDVNLTRQYTYLPADFSSHFAIERIALFGQTETQFGNDATVTAGLRLEHHSSSYEDNAGVSFEPRDRLMGGRIALDRAVSEALVAYSSISRGYKAGGFNTSGTLDADLREFAPETLWNYEVGIKARSLEDRLTIRAAVFYMQRKNVQIASSIVRTRSNGSSEFIQFTGNAAEGRNTGLEADVEYLASPSVLLFARLGLLDSEYRNFVSARGKDLDGREQAHAPSYQFHLGADFEIGDRLFATFEFEGRDAFFFSDSHTVKSKSYELINASMSYVDRYWTVRAWGRNLAKKNYLVRGFSFGNDPRDGYSERAFTQLGEPRRLGITIIRSW